MHFREWKVLYLDYIVTKLCSKRPNWQLHNIGLDRLQAIIWTNADRIHWWIYVALGEDPLKDTFAKLTGGNYMYLSTIITSWVMTYWI